jgi:hypothetical protein
LSIRFRKSFTLAPGVRMNLSGSGIGWTLGPRGASIGIGKSGVYSNLGIPGTGISARKRLSSPTSSRHQSHSDSAIATTQVTISVNDEGLLRFIASETGLPLSDAMVEIVKKQHGDAVRKLIQDKCDQINSQIEGLGNIHLFTPDLNARLAYAPRSFSTPPPPMGKLRRAGILAWLFKSQMARVVAANTATSQAHERELSTWRATMADHNSIEAAKKLDDDRVVAGDVPAMERFLENSLQDIVWPRETAVSFQITDGKTVELDVDLPEIEDMPSKTAHAPQRGLRLTIKEVSPTQLSKLYMRHVHAIGFRIIGETFAALPTSDRIALSAYSKRPDKATGQLTDQYLYSVVVTRPQWSQLSFGNLKSIDVIEAFDRFQLRRNMTKTGIFRAIEPVAVRYDLLDDAAATAQQGKTHGQYS